MVFAIMLFLAACGGQPETTTTDELVEKKNASEEALQQSIERVDSTVSTLNETLDSLQEILPEEE